MLRSTVYRTNVIQGVIASWSSLQVSNSLIKARSRQVEASELAYIGTEEEAKLGARTTLDLLNAEQALMNSKTELATAESDSLVAGFELLMAIGKLNRDTLGL